jgi:predicted permease
MQHAILDKLAALPGITAVAFSSSVPMEGVRSADPIYAEGRNYAEGQVPPIRRYKYVSPGFFQTTGTRLIAGRDITWTDLYDHRPVALVSENLARELWGGAAEAVGKRIRQAAGGGPWREIVGVAQDVYDDGAHQRPPTIVYWPTLTQNFFGNPANIIRSVIFSIRSERAGTESFLTEVRQAIWSVNPDLPLALVRTMREIYDRSLAATSFTLVMLAIAGAMALALGMIGIYGALSYTVSQRMREIGIRLALGAQPGALSRMFVQYGLALAGIGVLIGSAAAAALTRLIKTLLFGIGSLDPLTYAAAPLLLVLAAMVASYLPARRAAAVDPVEALKAD